MDFVYVVVSEGKDTYLAQTILSIESLKKTNPQARATVLVDQGTALTLEGRRHKLYDTADEVKVVECPEAFNNKLRSRYLKTTMYHHMESDFVYIDGDTLVCGDLSYVEGDYDIGAVPDRHYLFSNHPCRESTMENDISPCGYRVYGDKYINTGFLVVRKGEKAEQLFRLWEQLWKEGLTHGVSQDQPSLNEANYRMGGIIHELSGIWNCQISCHSAWMQYLHDAKILHYFASNGREIIPYTLSDELLRHALDDAYPDELQAILDNPKAAFSVNMHILTRPLDIKIYHSDVFYLAFLLCNNKLYKPVFNLLNIISRCIIWLHEQLKKVPAVRRKSKKVEQPLQ